MKKIYKVTCPNCGKENQLLNDYVYYFRQYAKTTPGAFLICSCGVPIDITGIGEERYTPKYQN